ncbi:hypothetical protein JQ559_10205 [Bradyrhizobium viridifuturi]|uniref:hypothetical protein n=1 Tax=Bradyrhizobium TaxID=374 RepID=UPI001304CE69|nr:hypothetical protein [Bradyrhizobium viridifuturi]QRI72796.1 hypothetical protein JQ507_15555 [Bradyrhizobium sp. PSBB068]MBR1035787.1 hypothetical protein [Bradyrhizobium viridifuturi]MBR1044018.1 hypothetical protein [Bradyrhizobium viridifuturi]MBR1073695.1 hypothetical protein [Bradyrhizobium viridifuturi]MBR1081412.1 hypothetical protein [Bradyrhizobium viridifuturi]
MIFSENRFALFRIMLQRPLDIPAPTLMPPPSFTQVSVPSTLTKPAPYDAQGLLRVADFDGNILPASGGVWKLRRSPVCANAVAGSRTAMTAKQVLRIRPLYRAQQKEASARI